MKKRFAALSALFVLLCGCGMTPLNAPFEVPQGLLVTTVSAPLSTDVKGISFPDDFELIEEKQSFSFFWLPFMTPTVAVSDRIVRPDNETYIDYDYFSIFGGLFSSVTLRRYGK